MFKSIFYILILFLSVVNISEIAIANDSFILSSLNEAKNISIKSDKPILLIFGTSSCKYCEQLKNDLIKNKLPIDRLIVCYIDIEENSDYIREYKVSSIPDSRILYKSNKTLAHKGYGKQEYTKWLNSYYEQSK